MVAYAPSPRGRTCSEALERQPVLRSRPAPHLGAGWGRQLCPLPPPPLALEPARGRRLAARTAEQGRRGRLHARRLPGRIPRESEEGQIRLRALPRAVGGRAEVRHLRLPAGRPSPPLPASSGQPTRPSGPGRGAKPAGRLGRAGAPRGGAGGREAARGRRGAAVRGRAGDAAPQCCERPGGFTAAAAAGAPPARPGRCRLLPTMHPGARGCPLFPQPSSPAPSFPPTSPQADTRKEARPLGCGKAEAGPGADCRTAPARTAYRARGGFGACGRVSRDSGATEPQAPPVGLACAAFCRSETSLPVTSPVHRFLLASLATTRASIAEIA